MEGRDPMDGCYEIAIHKGNFMDKNGREGEEMQKELIDEQKEDKLLSSMVTPSADVFSSKQNIDY